MQIPQRFRPLFKEQQSKTDFPTTVVAAKAPLTAVERRELRELTALATANVVTGASLAGVSIPAFVGGLIIEALGGGAGYAIAAAIGIGSGATIALGAGLLVPFCLWQLGKDQDTV